MRMRYDKEGDVLDLLVNDEQIHHAEEYDQIIVNFDEKNRIVEIEILNASEFIGGLFVGALRAEPKGKGSVLLYV
jgi:uncharacterized protein YuzE